MSKVSTSFGEVISDFLKRNSFTFRAAAFKSGISAAYWKDMSDGRVPSEDVIAKISAAFDDLNENDLRLAAGYAPNLESVDLIGAIEIAMRGNETLSDDGKKQILDFAREMVERYSHGDKA
ncbi:MAG: hypothetical protein ABFD54_16920 [Armatimonadota bacterium]|nr:hypothetical protein [bacterium]